MSVSRRVRSALTAWSGSGRRPILLLVAVVVALLAGSATVLLAIRDSSDSAAGKGDGKAPADAPYRNASLPVAQRVEDLLARMTLDDKAGQMAQVERGYLQHRPEDITTYRIGSILSGGGSAPAENTPAGWADMYDGFQRAALDTPLGIPIVYGVDAVHGHNTVKGATIFPHNIGLGATGDADLVRRIGEATAEEVAATGLDWTFGPCVCVLRDDRWGRAYECFGETPEIVSPMTSIVTGLQGEKLGGTPNSILATAKHYLGDGGTVGGDDQGDTRLSEAALRELHLPPYEAAVKAGAGSVMVSFSSVEGDKMHGHKHLITDVLKGELGFTGFVVSDYAGIDQLDGEKGFTADEVATAINAGIDMVMIPEDYQAFVAHIEENVSSGRIPLARVDDAVRRILTKKFELGLFEKPFADRSLANALGSPEHKALAREAVAKSVVLLKNDDALPLDRKDKIFVAGKNADDIGNASGGWTMTWQGASGDITPGTTILEGIREVAGKDAEITYDEAGKGVDSSYDVAVAVVGETPYAEFEGDRPDGLSLDDTDLKTIARLRKAGIPVVVVLVSGRTMDIASELDGWAGLVAAWLPGTEGAGVADVLFGDADPTGRLPVTWMKSVDQQPINKGDDQKPLFPLGFGLDYDD
ncbi:MAG: beta-glucosidase [Actinomycetales bacterium]|nr:beta-glucosidase [Actinomycetales bacterium]